MDFILRMKQRKEQIDEILNNLVIETPVHAKVLEAAMRHSLLAKGKRLRPILLLETLQLFGKHESMGMNFALALEMIHTFTLVHDDLPCMDDDDLRRGIPTCHKVFGENIALLAGDALVFSAYELMSKRRDDIDPAVGLACIEDISKALGAQGVIAGQVVDLLSEGKTASEEVLHFIHKHKTADLMVAALQVGARLGGADDDELQSLRHYGEHIGLAFQMTDDLLDIEGQKDVLGKPIGSDVKSKKMTYPVLLGLAETKSRAKTECLQAQEALKSINYLPISFLDDFSQYILARTY